ncbi:MAG: hypothetical protein MRY83_03990 [Flavobacteriales bacterium]|nr:hypothetical protein [Flavobacteriales bacterium]
MRITHLLPFLLTLCFFACQKKEGCTDGAAKNYDAEAIIDDGTCHYKTRGCTDETAANYNPLAEEDDGSCRKADDDDDDDGGNNGGGNNGGGGVQLGWDSSNMAYTFQHSGTTYKIIADMKSFADANQAACDSGGHLVYINDAAEQAAVYSEIQASGISTTYTTVNDGGGIAYIWIGANDITAEGTWKWEKKGTACTSVGIEFWSGQGAAGAGGGSATNGEYNNWGGASTGTPNEPDNFNSNQNAGAIALDGWPAGSGSLGSAGEWNDIAESNLIYYIIEL